MRTIRFRLLRRPLRLRTVAPELSPTARALQALELLRLRPGITAAQLALDLGVSDRAARRYVAILREAGIDVDSARGRFGGYRLARGTRLPPVVFEEDQALALVMAVLESHPATEGASALVHTALQQVIRALPEDIGRQAAALRDHAATAPDRRAVRPDPTVTLALVRAVASRNAVRLSYRGASGSRWEGEVDPWAVVVRHGRWYLLGHSHHAQATRSYRVDRVSAVTALPRCFAVPDGLDPVTELEQNLGAGWRFATRVRFQAPVADVAPWVHPPMGRLHADGGGCVLSGSTGNPAMYAQEWLAPIPFAFAVEGGAELRAAVAALAERCAAAVAGASAALSRRPPGR